MNLTVYEIDELDPADAARLLTELASTLRQGDREEVQASSALSPDEAIKASVALSTLTFIVLDEARRPVLAMGVAPHMIPNLGVPWLLGSDLMAQHRHEIGRRTPTFVAALHEGYTVLTNYVDARNRASLRWLQWAGFEMIDADFAHGPEDRLFFQFARHADV